MPVAKKKNSGLIEKVLSLQEDYLTCHLVCHGVLNKNLPPPKKEKHLNVFFEGILFRFICFSRTTLYDANKENINSDIAI